MRTIQQKAKRLAVLHLKDRKSHVLLWLVIGCFLVTSLTVCLKVDPTAAYLLLPYLGWSTFATVNQIFSSLSACAKRSLHPWCMVSELPSDLTKVYEPGSS